MRDQQRFQYRKGREVALGDVCIETDRVRLIPNHSRFAEDILKEFTPEITRYMVPTPAKSIDDTLAFIQMCTDNIAAGTDLTLVATNITSGEFLGCVGLHLRVSPQVLDFGLWFKRSVHGQGFGYESILALKEWAEGHLEVAAFRYPVDKANIPSRRIPEKLGGVIVEELRAPTMDPDRFLDEIVFEIPVG